MKPLKISALNCRSVVIVKNQSAAKNVSFFLSGGPGVSRGAKQWFEKIPPALSYTVYEAVYIVYSIHRLALMALYPVSFYGLAVAL